LQRIPAFAADFYTELDSRRPKRLVIKVLGG
jgi:hypothetical protein